jgi:hypothetical protein
MFHLHVVILRMDIESVRILKPEVRSASRDYCNIVHNLNKTKTDSLATFDSSAFPIPIRIATVTIIFLSGHSPEKSIPLSPDAPELPPVS